MRHLMPKQMVVAALLLALASPVLTACGAGGKTTTPSLSTAKPAPTPECGDLHACLVDGKCKIIIGLDDMESEALAKLAAATDKYIKAHNQPTAKCPHPDVTQRVMSSVDIDTEAAAGTLTLMARSLGIKP